MKYSTRKYVLIFIAAIMVDVPCMALGESHSAWKRLPDMAVPRWEAEGLKITDNPYAERFIWRDEYREGWTL